MNLEAETRLRRLATRAIKSAELHAFQFGGVSAQYTVGLDIIRSFHSIGNMDKQDVISSLAALAQETRLDVFRALVQAGPEGLPAGAIGTVLEIPSATLSFHLKELKSSGLIRCERQGTSRIYSPNLSAVNDLITFLTANCCRGVADTGSIAEGCDFDDGIDC